MNSGPRSPPRFGSSPAPLLLDQLLSVFDLREVHRIWVPAPPPTVFAAIKEVTVREVRVLTPLEALRWLPGALAGRGGVRPRPAARVLDAFTVGAVPLGERPGEEIVAGAVGRFWHWAGNEPAAVHGREDFLSFAEPGYAKAAIGFVVGLERGGSIVVTETRVATTSPDARRALRRYWGVIRIGSSIIRRSWLAAIRRRALRAHLDGDAAPPSRARFPRVR